MGRIAATGAIWAVAAPTINNVEVGPKRRCDRAAGHRRDGNRARLRPSPSRFRSHKNSWAGLVLTFRLTAINPPAFVY